MARSEQGNGKTFPLAHLPDMVFNDVGSKLHPHQWYSTELPLLSPLHFQRPPSYLPNSIIIVEIKLMVTAILVLVQSLALNELSDGNSRVG